MSVADYAPRIGIIIPVYKHSVLVSEAVNSVLCQRGSVLAMTVLVNDGCPLIETSRNLRSYALAYPNSIINLHTPNGGLSAARNRGINLLLSKYPSIEGFLFLDADNRLEPNALEVFNKLLDKEDRCDWFYPQFDMFGVISSAGHGGPWSLLLHSSNNFCEAGSLVRRNVFESGVRYDESMRLGYEDWDFWLACAKQGFRGKATEIPFLRYRKRPESMLSGSHRVDSELRGYIRRKHSWLYNVKASVALEHVEAPRFRILFSDSARILALSDPLSPSRSLSSFEFTREVWQWLTVNSEAEAGAFWIFTTNKVWADLADRGLLRFAMWDLERRLSISGVATITIKAGDGNYLALMEPANGKEMIAQSGMVAVSTILVKRILLSRRVRLIDSLVKLNRRDWCSHRVIEAIENEPAFKNVNYKTFNYLVATLKALRASDYQRCVETKWAWRSFDFKFRDQASLVARLTADSGVLYPVALHTTDPRSVCFILPIAEFGGVETVALNLASAMRRRGWRTALCVIGSGPVKLAGDARAAFDEFLWFPEESLFRWGGPVYHGTRLAHAAEGILGRDLLGLLGTFDCVIGCHPAGAISIMGPLKQQGVVTALHEHVVEVSHWGRFYGSPIIATAYEAAIDVIATCSIQLVDWLHAHGIPQAKLMAIPNAAGFELSDVERLAVIKNRANTSEGRQLRVLFIGRLDWQKGLDRLTSIISNLNVSNIFIEWRIVGKSIINDGLSDLEELCEFVSIEDPVYTHSERSDLYAWADIVMLPSRYEGLPLTIFEAQSLGAVPIITHVGAVEEGITNGVNGIIVQEDTCVDEITSILIRLNSNRSELKRLSEAAANRRRSWDAVACPFIDRLEIEVDRSRKLRFTEGKAIYNVTDR